MRRTLWLIIWSLLALAIIALIAWAFAPRPVPVDVAEVRIGPMQVAVEEDGQTRIRHRYVISAPLAGRIDRITLEPGDAVEAGQTLLATIQPTDPALLDVRSEAEARARVGVAEAALQQIQAQLDRARAALDFAADEFARISTLYERNATGVAEFRQAQFRRDAAIQDLRAAEFAQQVAAFELEQARAALVRATGEPEQAQSAFRIVAPVDGVVLRRFQESAAVVSPGTSLLEIGDPADLEAVIDVLSTDAVRIRPGYPVSLERWGGGEALAGVVRVVEPAAFTKVSALGVEEQRVNVIIDFASAVEQRQSLGDAYRVEARIILWQDEQVLQVPAGALFRDAGREWTVFAIEAGRAVRRPVRIGQRSGLWAQVTEGLEPGERVIAYPSDQITDGTRVTER